MHIDTINYGTGENTLLAEWYKLIYYIRKNYPKIGQALTTNGYLANKVFSNSSLWENVSYSIDEVDVSLDYANSEKHNYMRGNNNAYKWAIETLKFCKKENIKSIIVFLGLEDVLKKVSVKHYKIYI